MFAFLAFASAAAPAFAQGAASETDWPARPIHLVCSDTARWLEVIAKAGITAE